MQNIKNIIFDYGNVIFLLDFNRIHHTFTELGISNIEHFFGHAGQNKLFDDFDKGTISAAEFRDAIRKETGKNASDEQIDEAWNSLLIGVPAVNHQLLLRAKKKYRTFLLSNNNEIHYKWILDYLNREYNITSNAGFFEKDYYSHLMGMRKPDSDIFEFVLQEQKLTAEETLFIDDSQKNVAAAEKLGMQTHLMQANDSLEKYFLRSGLLKTEL
ncbi:HAD family hydrolase [Rubrolithibacter danxiaensis]|uniref:HAD family hydrolase n=1 Tax=Rubrolithibacter danxiaensis TaxID=3390805 RepID=UPI003BF7F606